MVLLPEKEPDDWQKKYIEEARRIVKESREEYDNMVKMSYVITSKRCETGNHQTDNKLFFCNQCKRSFCEKHGSERSMLCESCMQMSSGMD